MLAGKGRLAWPLGDYRVLSGKGSAEDLHPGCAIAELVRFVRHDGGCDQALELAMVTVGAASPSAGPSTESALLRGSFGSSFEVTFELERAAGSQTKRETQPKKSNGR